MPAELVKALYQWRRFAENNVSYCVIMEEEVRIMPFESKKGGSILIKVRVLSNYRFNFITYVLGT
jgi:hypothetical protein